MKSVKLHLGFNRMFHPYQFFFFTKILMLPIQLKQVLCYVLIDGLSM